MKDEYEAFLSGGILAHGFLQLHCGDCRHDKLVAFSCKRRASTRHAVPGAWRKRRCTWWITSSARTGSALRVWSLRAVRTLRWTDAPLDPPKPDLTPHFPSGNMHRASMSVLS